MADDELVAVDDERRDVVGRQLAVGAVDGDKLSGRRIEQLHAGSEGANGQTVVGQLTQCPDVVGSQAALLLPIDGERAVVPSCQSALIRSEPDTSVTGMTDRHDDVGA